MIEQIGPEPDPWFAREERIATSNAEARRHLSRELGEQDAKIEQLRFAGREVIRLARDFNRGAMTWQEYDRKLAALEPAFDEARGD